MKLEVSFSSLDRKRNPGGSVTNYIKDPRFGVGGCHNLSPLYELKVTDDPDYHVWQYKPTACLPNSYLYGPASMKDSKVVVYPCYRRKCVIQCPCKLCRGIQEEYPNYQEDFEDHRRYHHAPHLGCNFCNNAECTAMLKLQKVLRGFKERLTSHLQLFQQK